MLESSWCNTLNYSYSTFYLEYPGCQNYVYVNLFAHLTYPIWHQLESQCFHTQDNMDPVTRWCKNTCTSCLPWAAPCVPYCLSILHKPQGVHNIMLTLAPCVPYCLSNLTQTPGISQYHEYPGSPCCSLYVNLTQTPGILQDHTFVKETSSDSEIFWTTGHTIIFLFTTRIKNN